MGEGEKGGVGLKLYRPLYYTTFLPPPSSFVCEVLAEVEGWSVGAVPSPNSPSSSSPAATEVAVPEMAVPLHSPHVLKTRVTMTSQ